MIELSRGCQILTITEISDQSTTFSREFLGRTGQSLRIQEAVESDINLLVLGLISGWTPFPDTS